MMKWQLKILLGFHLVLGGATVEPAVASEAVRRARASVFNLSALLPQGFTPGCARKPVLNDDSDEEVPGF